MSFLIPSIACASKRLPPIIASGSRYNSSIHTPNSQPRLFNSAPSPLLSQPSSSTSYQSRDTPPDLSGVKIPNFTATDPDDWWGKKGYHARIGYPGNQFTGRQFPVIGHNAFKDFNAQFRRLGNLLRRSNVRRELKLGEYYEKPGDKKRRLVSERHRRRFQETVRRKVQMVQTIRNRG